MITRSKRAKLGDVVRFKTPKGFAYLQFIGRHPEYGDAVLVSSDLHGELNDISAEIFRDSYVTFYPLSAAVAQGLVEVTSNLTPPKMPNRFRRAGARFGDRISTWIVEDGSSETVKARLSDEDLRLPIAAIWNHEFLTQRLMERWNPLKEGYRDDS